MMSVRGSCGELSWAMQGIPSGRQKLETERVIFYILSVTF
ncbi:hypothetical protein RA11412_0568 [Rothia aeria]|uniref:Uncharacterized protein n=1 Tax=Rothia aeria TaxID=172042 RepID=A0A2Z5QWQ9_9MICC|nr:hypothetical protein RA11412_0568 [Rothia aeria]